VLSLTRHPPRRSRAYRPRQIAPCCWPAERIGPSRRLWGSGRVQQHLGRGVTFFFWGVGLNSVPSESAPLVQHRHSGRSTLVENPEQVASRFGPITCYGRRTAPVCTRRGTKGGEHAESGRAEWVGSAIARMRHNAVGRSPLGKTRSVPGVHLASEMRRGTSLPKVTIVSAGGATLESFDNPAG
jgi:hypothetical protein